MKPGGPAQRVVSSRCFRPLRGQGLGAKAARGAGWTLIGFGLNKGLGLVSTLVLTRLLFPEAFGLMSLAGVFMTGLQMFSDIGIRPSIIQNKRGDDPDFLNTAWTMQVIRGFVLWMIACVIAYPVSLAYGEPLLFPILCVIGSTAAIRGFQTTGYATANRKLLLGKLTMVELVTHAIGIGVTVAWAWAHPTVWSLVGGGVVSSMISVSLGFRVLSTHRHRFRWDTAAASELYRFGKWIFVSTALTFLAQSGDKLILPGVLGIENLGYYAIAVALLMIPVSIFKQIASRVMFPVYSTLLNSSGTDRVNRVTKKYTLTTLPLYLVPVGLLFFAQPLVALLYEPRYGDVGSALSILAVGGYLAMMRATQAGLLLAAGRSKYATMTQCARIFIGLPAGVLMARYWGLEGFCVGMVLAEGSALLVQRSLARRAVPGLSGEADVALLFVLLASVLLRVITV